MDISKEQYFSNGGGGATLGCQMLDVHQMSFWVIQGDPKSWIPYRRNHLNIGPSYVCKKAVSQEHWHSIVDTAALKKSML